MGGQPWRLVPAAVTLREQIDARFPKRDKASDGSIGDPAHASRVSDHNPDDDGWVHAIDVDEDLGEPGAMRALADELVQLARDGRDGGRLKNLVYEDQVASGTYPATFWQWRGQGYEHFHHLHISFTAAAETDASPFPLGTLAKPKPKPKPPVKPPAVDQEDDDMLVIRNASTKETSLVSGSLVTRVEDRTVGNLKAAGIKVVDVTAADYTRLTAEGA